MAAGQGLAVPVPTHLFRLFLFFIFIFIFVFVDLSGVLPSFVLDNVSEKKKEPASLVAVRAPVQVIDLVLPSFVLESANFILGKSLASYLFKMRSRR